MPSSDKTYHFYFGNSEENFQSVKVKRSEYPLTQIEEYLLIAAVLQNKGTKSSLEYAGTGKIIRQALRLSGMSLNTIDEVWGSEPTHTIIDDYHDALIRLTKTVDRKHDRFQFELFEGGGNWGQPDGRPPAFPDFTSCRLSYLGELMANDLLKLHPEYQELKMQ